MPARHAQHEATYSGAERWGDGNDHGDNAHYAAAALRRDEGHRHRHQGGDHQGGAGRLEYAAHQQHAEGRGERRQHRTGKKNARRCQEDLPGGELIHEKAGGRDDHAHGEEETGKQPLGGGSGDAEVRHDGGQRHRQGGLVQDHHHRAEDEDGEVDFYLCGNVGIWFLRHPDRILRPRVRGKSRSIVLVSSSAR